MIAQDTLRRALSLNDSEWSIVVAAARDAHVHVREYCRLMVLAMRATAVRRWNKRAKVKP